MHGHIIFHVTMLPIIQQQTMEAEQWKPKPKATPELDLDLRDRLFWVKYTRDDKSYWWPAVLYSGFDEFQYQAAKLPLRKWLF